MMKIFFTISVTFFFSIHFLFSQIPNGYYDSAQGLEGAALKTALHNIIKSHSSVSYSSLHNYYSSTDKKSNGKVWDMYSDNPGGNPPYEFTFGNTCGNYSGEGDCYNREHSWPQSWFNSSSPMQSDLFHVYPTDGYVNGKRSDWPYGKVNSPTWTSQNGSKLGPCISPGYTGTAFEPIDAYKGDFARTYFYMSVRYYTEDGAWQSNSMVTKSIINDWALKQLYEWHIQDPVSQKEIDRNNAVYQIQNNRNPFIDNPEWVMSIWSNILSKEELNFSKSIFVYPNPAKEIITISGNINISCRFEIVNFLGEVIKCGTINNSETKISINEFSNGIYFLNLTSEKFKLVKKFIISN